MEFKTHYTKQQIFSTLNIHTKPYNFSYLMHGNILVSKHKDNKIFLLKTGSLGVGRGQRPFIAKLIERSDCTIIKGGFYCTTPLIIFLIIFVGFAWYNVFKSSLFNPNVDLNGKIIACFAVGIWSAFAFLVCFIPDKIFFEKRQKAVIEFIEKDLHAKIICK